MMPKGSILILLTAAFVLVASPAPGRAQECEPAATAVEVHASVAGSDALTVSYTVVNNTRGGLRWISIGAGGRERTRVVPQQTPVIRGAPPGWQGKVVYPEETPFIHLWWEAKDMGAALPDGGSTSGFVAGVAGPAAVPPGLVGPDGRSVRPIDFATLPFTAGGTGAQCWWGRVRPVTGPHSDAWAALVKGGHVALIRHGNAPPGYGGDPPGFKVDDCKTQRNLDELGREQARAIGEAFRSHGVRVDRVLSSPWCRCLETARLMAVGPVESSWALVPDREPSSPARLLELKAMVSAWRGPGTLVLVTHALTVRPLIGILPNQAEAVVLRPEPGSPAGAELVGRIAAPR